MCKIAEQCNPTYVQDLILEGCQRYISYLKQEFQVAKELRLKSSLTVEEISGAV
jgi:hypothetical protein